MLSEMCSTILWAHLTFNWKTTLTMRITGTHFNDYWLCHRKLWLFANGLTMEQDSNLVCEGKMLHQYSYPQRTSKYQEVAIEGIKVDYYDANSKVIHEIKKVEQMRYSPWMAIKILYLYFWAQWNHRSKRHFGISTPPKNYRGAFERRGPRRYSSHRNEQTSGIENANEIHHTRR